MVRALYTNFNLFLFFDRVFADCVVRPHAALGKLCLADWAKVEVLAAVCVYASRAYFELQQGKVAHKKSRQQPLK